MVVAAGSELDEELLYVLPHPLRCSRGTVRLYLPGVRLDAADTDSRRHRFVKGSEIDEATPLAIEDRFVSAVARRLPVRFAEVAWGIDDLERREREARFAALRGQLAASADRELLQLFEEDNIAFQKDNRDLKALVEQREDELEELLELHRLLDPREGPLRPRRHPLRWPSSVPEQELLESMPHAQWRRSFSGENHSRSIPGVAVGVVVRVGRSAVTTGVD